MSQSLPKAPSNISFQVDGAVANIATRVDLPDRCEEVILRFVGNDGKLAFEGQDGAAIGTYYPVDADTDFRVTVRRGPRLAPLPVYVASATVSTQVVIIVTA